MSGGVLLLLPDCVLPGCRNVVAEYGQVCSECAALFDGSLGGWFIRPTAGAPMTAEQIAERDTAVKTAYAEQAAIVRLASVPELEWKHNQLCWICDQRRRCARVKVGVELRWECRDCQEIE